MATKRKSIGEIIHYFSKIKVVIIKLAAPLAVGDEINIIGGENTDFNATVKSMEVEHEKLEKAKKGMEVGIKVSKKVREGYKVFKVE